MIAPETIVASIKASVSHSEYFNINPEGLEDITGFNIGIITIEGDASQNNKKYDIELIPDINEGYLTLALQEISQLRNTNYNASNNSYSFTTKDCIYIIATGNIHGVPMLYLAGLTVQIKAFDEIYEYTFPTNFNELSMVFVGNQITFTKT